MTAFSELSSRSLLSNHWKVAGFLSHSKSSVFPKKKESASVHPFIGSRALVGTLDEELLNRQDANGISVRDAIKKLWTESIRNSARGA